MNGITKIYLVTNCYGDPNKVYIGKEKINKTRRSRKDDHKKTYGKDIIFIYIDEVDSLYSKDWKPLECFWIEYFRQLGFDIQNKNKGGGGPSFQTEESKNKIRKIHKGRKCTEDSKNKMRFPRPNAGAKYPRDSSFSNKISKPILQYDLEGNFIQEWKNLPELSKYYSTNSIRECCVKNQRKAHGFLWRYKSENITKPNMIDRKKRPENTCNKNILQYDLEGNFIQKWNGIKNISRDIVRCNRNISNCCTNKSKTAYGFIWRYEDNPLK